MEPLLPSIHWRIPTSYSCWQLETITVCNTPAFSVIIGITRDPKLTTTTWSPKDYTPTTATPNSPSVSARNGVFGALVHTEQEGVGVGLRDTWGWGFPFSCREATKDEILGSLNDSERPPLVIGFSMEIPILPPICGGIINPLESSLRILVPNELDDHIPMGGGPKGLGSSKICLGVVFQNRIVKGCLRNRYFGYPLSFDFFRCRPRARFSQQFLGLTEVSLRFWELQINLLVFFFSFSQILTERSNLSILLVDDGRERLDVIAHYGRSDILRLSNHSYPNFI